MISQVEIAPSYLPIDRRLALVSGRELPSDVAGTALDADLSGFTALTELLAERYGEQRGAEELASRLNAIYDGLIRCIHDYGGTVLGFAGDAFSGWLDGDDGRRGVACALALQDWMAASAAEASGGLPAPRLKVAVATGRTRRFLVGDPDVQLLEGLAGALVDELAAAGHDAEPGEVVLGPSTRASLADGVRTDARGALLEVLSPLIEPTPWSALDLGTERLDQVRPWLLAPVFNRLAAGEGSFLAELRPATAVFMRMSGIRYETDPAALDRLDEFVRRVQGVLASYGGTLIQLTIGDKGSYLYAAFGAPVAHEDDQVRALLAALELRELGGTSDHPGLVDPVSIGVATGRLRSGSYGGSQRRTYGVLGDTVNLAARLMQAAGPGQIVATRALADAAAGFGWASMPDLTVKGKRDPVAVSSLVGVRTAIPTPRRHEAGEDGGPMLGRADELAALLADLAIAENGRGRVITVAAEAGMGKTRLVGELLQLAARRGVAAHRSDCPSYGVNSSYLVWRPIWRELLALPDSGSDAALLQIAGEQLARIGTAQAQRLPLLAPVLGVAADENDLTAELDPKVRKTAIETTLVEWLRATVRRPTVVVLEDCHWIDPLSEDLLTAIGRAVRDLPVLLVVTMRPRADSEGGPLAIHSLPHFREVALDRLGDADIEEMIRGRLEHASLPRALSETVSVLSARAEGNPFYVEELLDYIVELAAEGLDPDRLAELPSTLQSLVLSRIDRLAERPRSVLKVASVVGRSFAADLLPSAHPELGSDEDIRGSLKVLSRADFVVDEGVGREVYAFKHAITQEVAYSTLVEATRVSLHARIGRAIEELAGEDTGRVVDLLAHHFARGDDDARRRTYVLMAADAAAARWANRAAAELFGNVLPLLDLDERGDVLLKLGRALSLTGHLDAAAEAFDDAFATGEQIDDAVLKARAQTEHGELARKLGRYDEAAAQFAAARERLEAEHHRAGVAEVLHLEGTLAAQRGDTGLARERFEAGLAIRRIIGDRRGVSRALNGLGIVAEYENDLPRAAQLYAEALAINVEIGDQWGVAATTNNQGYALLLQDNADDALPLFERAVDLEREVGDPSMLANFLSNLGDAHRDRGNLTAATSAYDEALELARELDERWLACYLLEDVAVLCARRNDPAEAVRLAAAGAALREAVGAPLPAESARLLEARLEGARLSLSVGQHQAALRTGARWTFDEAIDHAVGAGRST